MEIKVLGAGCQKCRALEERIRKVIEENSLEADVQKVEDIMEIMTFGVMATPAMVVDGKVMVKGRVPSSREIKEILTKIN